MLKSPTKSNYLNSVENFIKKAKQNPKMNFL